MDVTIGAVTFDAFADKAYADAFLAGDVLRAASWALLNDDAKGRGLVSGTRMMVALPWLDPIPDPADDGTNIPDVVKQVASMLAADLTAKPRLFADASGGSNVKSVKAGSASVEFFSPVEGGPAIPLSLWRMLVDAGLVGSGLADPDTLDGAIVHGISCGRRPLNGRPAWDYPIAAQDYD